MTNLYDIDTPIREYGIDVPAWIDQDISPADVAAILEGGCESGAYMPAVTYADALRIMGEHGDEVLDYISETWGSIPAPADDLSWAGHACHYLSFAVECWASSVESDIEDALEEAGA